VSGVEQVLAVDMELFEWDKTYMNPLYGKVRPRVDFPILFDLYLNGSLMLDELVTSTYSLGQVEDAFVDLLNGANAKGVIILD
jgi:Zn-dependent alcohol dehydrogenase